MCGQYAPVRLTDGVKRMFAALAVAAFVLAGAGCARRRLLVVTVDGPSMEPTFHEGDRLLVVRTGPERIGRAEVVVVRHPRDRSQLLVKRVAAIAGDPVPATGRAVPPDLRAALPAVVPPGQVYVAGDNRKLSLDSRSLGCLDRALVIGVVRHRLRSTAGVHRPPTVPSVHPSQEV